jgi:Chalcone isomerase-like
MEKSALLKCVGGICLAIMAGMLYAAAGVKAAPPDPSVQASAEVRWAVPEPVFGGRAKLNVWGFDIYHANLWVAPGFKSGDYAKHPFAIELAYLRDFKRGAIASRSITEMARQAKSTPNDQAGWERQMRDVFPDVKAGDRILGVNLPGEGARFLTNGKPSGEIRDPEFARLFFGIWLSPSSSEPKMRLDLLAHTVP